MIGAMYRPSDWRMPIVIMSTAAAAHISSNMCRVRPGTGFSETSGRVILRMIDEPPCVRQGQLVRKSSRVLRTADGCRSSARNPLLAKQSAERGGFHRFGEVVIEAGLGGAVLVGLLPPAGDGDQRDAMFAVEAADAACDLVA